MRKKTKKSKRADVIHLFPVPSDLKRLTKPELLREIEQMYNISNLILERKAQDKLFCLNLEIHNKTLISHIADLEVEIKCIKGKLEKQAMQHKEDIIQASSDFPSAIAGHC